MKKTKNEKEKRVAFFQDFKVAPLNGGFMLMSIFGFLFATLFLAKYTQTWSFTIGFVSVLMFFASMISMTKAPVPEELLIDEHISDRTSRVTVMSKKHYAQHLKELEAKKTKKKTTKKVVKTTAKKKSVKKVSKTKSKVVKKK